VSDRPLSAASLTRGVTYRGKPCKYGHSGIRYESKGRSGGGCVECAQERAARRRKERK